MLALVHPSSGLSKGSIHFSLMYNSDECELRLQLLTCKVRDRVYISDASVMSFLSSVSVHSGSLRAIESIC